MNDGRDEVLNKYYSSVFNSEAFEGSSKHDVVDVIGDNYLGIQRFWFYFKCNRCFVLAKTWVRILGNMQVLVVGVGGLGWEPSKIRKD